MMDEREAIYYTFHRLLVILAAVNDGHRYRDKLCLILSDDGSGTLGKYFKVGMREEFSKDMRFDSIDELVEVIATPEAGDGES